MKVLFLTNIPSPYRVAFFNELGKMCELKVLYEKRYDSHRDKEWLSKPSENFTEVFMEQKKIRREAVICPSVISYLDSNLYDVIVIGGYSTPTGILAIQYCKRKNIPFILNADGGIINEENRIKYAFKRHLIGSAKAWLSTGFSTNQYLEHYGAINHKIFAYPFTSTSNADLIKVSEQEKREFKRILNIQDKPTVLSIGQFIHRKGFDVLLDSWVKLDKEFNLVIIGGGEKKTELEEQIEHLDLKNVTLIDFLSSDVLSQYYKAADLFILPTREDIWGLVINEAMAYGLPVITTDNCVAGIELISDNGYIVPVEDSAVLAEKAGKILRNDELREHMGWESLETIKSYTIENMAKVHLDIFNTYLGIDYVEHLYL